MRVQPTGIRHHPERRPAERFGLRPDHGRRPLECGSIRGDSKHCDDTGSDGFNSGGERPCAGSQFRSGEFVGTSGRPGEQVRYADSARDELGEVIRGKPVGCGDQSVGDTGAVERGIEPVASATEVRLDGDGSESRVDADEEQANVGAEKIG